MGQSYGMPFGFLRGMLGALCILFAYPWGRSWVRLSRKQERRSRLIAWSLRTIVTAVAVLFRIGFDALSIVVLTLAILSFAAGVYFEWRPKHHEELDKVMFPRQ